MIIALIDQAEAHGLNCAEGGDDRFGCEGRLFRFRFAHQMGFTVACERHLFKLGRGIADALHHFHHPDGETKTATEKEPESQPDPAKGEFKWS